MSLRTESDGVVWLVSDGFGGQIFDVYKHYYEALHAQRFYKDRVTVQPLELRVVV